MPSTYSTDLKLELMVTGEKAGLWGNITNTNLNILQQAIGGYEAIALNATTGATLTFSNGTTSDGKNAVLDLTGTITTSVNVVIPDGIEKTYIVRNSTSGAHDVVVKTTTGTGATFNTTDKGFKLVYSDGTDVVDIGMVSETGVQTLTNKTLTSPKINEAVEVTATATELNILDGVTATTAELNYSDIVTLGTTAASKVFTADANNLTIVSGAVVNVEDILTDGATITWDVIDSPVAKVTLGGNRTLSAPSGTTPFAGQFVSLLIIQDGTGGRTVTWNAVYEFAADTAPTLTATASLGDLFTFRYNGAKWLEVGRNLALTLS
jgi:hypothetical protein